MLGFRFYHKEALAEKPWEKKLTHYPKYRRAGVIFMGRALKMRDFSESA